MDVQNFVPSLALAEEFKIDLARNKRSDTHELCSLGQGEYDATNGSTRNNPETKIYTYQYVCREEFRQKNTNFQVKYHTIWGELERL